MMLLWQQYSGASHVMSFAAVAVAVAYAAAAAYAAAVAVAAVK